MTEKNLNVGSLVRVTHQPANQVVWLVNRVCVIVEIQDDFAHVQAIDMTGRPNGEGTLPLSCLYQEHNAAWVDAGSRWHANNR